MIKVLLLLVFALGGTWIVLLQADVIKRSYKRKKKHRKLSTTTRPLSLVVIDRQDLTDQHFSVRLQTVNNVALENFQPGQYITLLAQTQADQNNIQKRCYSLASWQKNPGFYELGIQRENHGQVSNWLHENLKPGTIIEALPPKGDFVFNLHQSEHVVLVAGGIGITPLRAMIHKFIAQKSNSLSPVKTMRLFYSAKSVDKMCYLDEFIKLADEHAEFYFYPTLSQAEKNWQGLTGRLDAKQLTQSLQPDIKSRSDKTTSDYYMCGPQEMMDNMKLGLMQQGIPLDKIHFERFGVGITSIGDEVFSVKLGSNKTITYQKQRSLLEALEQQGIEIESECRSGECGQCKIKLHRGEIRQLIEPDMDLDAGEILPCCCVPESDLLIGMDDRARY